MTFWAIRFYNIPWERSRKDLLNDIIIENDSWKYYLQKLETNPETCFVKEKIEIIMECYISLERFCQELFNSKVFENVDWN